MITPSNSLKILIVEDDKRFSRLISSYLTDHGYRITVETNGDSALKRMLEDQPDLVILDIMLPGIDGYTVCRQSRRENFLNPILMLTARSELMDELIGFDSGADDFLRKPVEPEALLARIQVLLRRGPSTGQRAIGAPFSQAAASTGQRPPGATLTTEDQIETGQLFIDRGARSAQFNGKAITLTSTEFDLIWLFAVHRGQALTRQQISQALHGEDYGGAKRAIDIHVSKLRKKLGDTADSPDIIKSIHGVGYLMVKNPGKV